MLLTVLDSLTGGLRIAVLLLVYSGSRSHRAQVSPKEQTVLLITTNRKLRYQTVYIIYYQNYMPLIRANRSKQHNRPFAGKRPALQMKQNYIIYTIRIV